MTLFFFKSEAFLCPILAFNHFQFLKCTLTVNNNFVYNKLQFCLSQCDLFILLNLTVGQGHYTVSGHLQSLCEVGPSIFYPEIARTDIQRTDRQGNSYDQLKTNFIYG